MDSFNLFMEANITENTEIILELKLGNHTD